MQQGFRSLIVGLALGIAIGVTPALAQQAPWLAVDPNGDLYVIANGQRQWIVPYPISSEELAELPAGPDLPDGTIEIAPAPMTPRPPEAAAASNPADADGSREAPIPIGASAVVDGIWEIRVLSVTPNANQIVAQENRFNDPPAPGRQFFMARIAVKYIGEGSRQFLGESEFRALGPSSVVLTTFQDSCGVIPDELPNKEVFSGGTVEGNVCWSVPAGDVGALVMFPQFNFRSTERVFFALY